jgi:hypothetical protein
MRKTVPHDSAERNELMLQRLAKQQGGYTSDTANHAAC